MRRPVPARIIPQYGLGEYTACAGEGQGARSQIAVLIAGEVMTFEAPSQMKL